MKKIVCYFIFVFSIFFQVHSNKIKSELIDKNTFVNKNDLNLLQYNFSLEEKLFLTENSCLKLDKNPKENAKNLVFSENDLKNNLMPVLIFQDKTENSETYFADFENHLENSENLPEDFENPSENQQIESEKIEISSENYENPSENSENQFENANSSNLYDSSQIGKTVNLGLFKIYRPCKEEKRFYKDVSFKIKSFGGPLGFKNPSKLKRNANEIKNLSCQANPL